MEYNENHYYLNKEDGNVIRLVDKKKENTYVVFDILSLDHKTIYFEGKDLIRVNENNEIENHRSNLFIKLTITVSSKLELNNPTKGKNIFKSFLDKLLFDFNSTLELMYNSIDSKYYFEGSILNGKITVLVEDDINDFFKKIDQILQIKLTSEQKDNFLREQFF